MNDSKKPHKNYEQLFSGRKESSNSHEKLIIEDLKKRLNDQLAKDPKKCKKAALILESWLHQKTKSKK